MPLIKKEDIMPLRPVVITLYGIPGVGKTSTACTSDNPILIDTDRGASRAINRVDTLLVTNWEEIVANMNIIKGYKTVVVDTVRSVLEDFMSEFAIRKNYKLANNSLKRFGEISETFRKFVNDLRTAEVDIIFVAHDKETTEGDIIRHSPDCIGQSKDLLLRVSDQVGYITMMNGKRVISWDPTDTTIGKNVANLPVTEIPIPSDVSYPTFMDNIVKQVKQSLFCKSEEQRKANQTLVHLRMELDEVDDNESAKRLLENCKSLPQIMKMPFFKEISDKLKERGFVFDKEKNQFIILDDLKQAKSTKKSVEKKDSNSKHNDIKDNSNTSSDGQATR